MTTGHPTDKFWIEAGDTRAHWDRIGNSMPGTIVFYSIMPEMDEALAA
jgi:hypothetical protein